MISGNTELPFRNSIRLSYLRHVRNFAHGPSRSILLYNLSYLTVYDCTRSLSSWLFSGLYHQPPVPLAPLTKIQDAPTSVERDTSSHRSYLLLVSLYDLGRMLRYSGSGSHKRQEPRAHVLLGRPLEWMRARPPLSTTHLILSQQLREDSDMQWSR
jgi:hypothetical protein